VRNRGDTQNDAPSLDLVGQVEIDEVYVSAGKKGRERDQSSRSRGLSTLGRGSYDGDKPPVFIITDRGTGQRYVIPAKAAEEVHVNTCSRPTEVSQRTS